MKTAWELLGRSYSAQLTGYVILSDDQLEAFAKRAREEMRAECATVCDAMVIGGRAWTHDQEVAADALGAAAKNIRALLVEAKP